MVNHHVNSTWTILYSEVRITQVSLSLLITEALYLYVSSSMEQRFLRFYVRVEDSNLLGSKKAHSPCTDLLQAEGIPES